VADNFNVALEYNGLAVTLKNLRRVDPELRKEVVREMKKAAKPMQATARALFPTAEPLRNWGNWRGGYDVSRVRSGVKVSFKGTRARDRDVIPLLTLRQVNPAGAIYDMAGRAGGKGRRSEGGERGRQMIGKLNMQGFSSRAMWPAAEKHLPKVQADVAKAIEAMTETINRELR